MLWPWFPQIGRQIYETNIFCCTIKTPAREFQKPDQHSIHNLEGWKHLTSKALQPGREMVYRCCLCTTWKLHIHNLILKQGVLSRHRKGVTSVSTLIFSRCCQHPVKIGSENIFLILEQTHPFALPRIPSAIYNPCKRNDYTSHGKITEYNPAWDPLQRKQVIWDILLYLLYKLT